MKIRIQNAAQCTNAIESRKSILCKVSHHENYVVTNECIRNMGRAYQQYPTPLVDAQLL